MDQQPEQGQGADLEMAMDPDQSMPDTLLEARQNQALVRQAMDRLPGEQRTALLLRATEGFSYGEIGQQLNRSENHVKTLIYRGRQRMKKILGTHWGKHDH